MLLEGKENPDTLALPMLHRQGLRCAFRGSPVLLLWLAEWAMHTWRKTWAELSRYEGVKRGSDGDREWKWTDSVALIVPASVKCNEPKSSSQATELYDVPLLIAPFFRKAPHTPDWSPSPAVDFCKNTLSFICPNEPFHPSALNLIHLLTFTCYFWCSIFVSLLLLIHFFL